MTEAQAVNVIWFLLGAGLMLAGLAPLWRRPLRSIVIVVRDLPGGLYEVTISSGPVRIERGEAALRTSIGHIRMVGQSLGSVLESAWSAYRNAMVTPLFSSIQKSEAGR